MDTIPPKSFLLENANIFTGMGGIVEGGYLLVRGGRISAVGEGTAPAGLLGEAERIDVAGRWVLPGLIDAHCHLCYGHKDKRDRGDPLVPFVGAANALKKVKAGVTTVRDVGAMDRQNLALKAVIDRGLVPGPRMLTSGDFISAPMGHCYYWGREARGPEQVRAAALSELEAGADLVKLMISGGVGEATQAPDKVEFDPEEIAAAVEVAHSRGKPVAVHAHPAKAIRTALETGCDTIEHGTYLEPDIIRTMAERRIAFVPTFCVYERMARDVDQWGEETARLVRSIWDAKVPRAREAVEAGVPVAVGTDSGTHYPPDDLATELRLFVEALGFTPAHAITAGTIDTARILGIASETGSLEEGKSADLFVVDGNPLESVEAVRAVRLVAVRGHILVR